MKQETAHRQPHQPSNYTMYKAGYAWGRAHLKSVTDHHVAGPKEPQAE